MSARGGAITTGGGVFAEQPQTTINTLRTRQRGASFQAFFKFSAGMGNILFRGRLLFQGGVSVFLVLGDHLFHAGGDLDGRTVIHPGVQRQPGQGDKRGSDSDNDGPAAHSSSYRSRPSSLRRRWYPLHSLPFPSRAAASAQS